MGWFCTWGDGRDARMLSGSTCTWSQEGTHHPDPTSNSCSHQASKHRCLAAFGSPRACERICIGPNRVSHSSMDSKLFYTCRCRTSLGPWFFAGAPNPLCLGFSGLLHRMALYKSVSSWSLTCLVLLLGVSLDERRRILAFLLIIDGCYLSEVLLREWFQMIWHLVHVHRHDQWPIEMCIAEELKQMGIRIPWELEAFAFQQQYM